MSCTKMIGSRFSLGVTVVIVCINESVVRPVSKRYTRAGIGNERLLVCLSEYLP